MLSSKLSISYQTKKKNLFFFYLDANERISTQDIENIAYQACDKIYKKDDNGPYESLW